MNLKLPGGWEGGGIARVVDQRIATGRLSGRAGRDHPLMMLPFCSDVVVIGRHSPLHNTCSGIRFLTSSYQYLA